MLSHSLQQRCSFSGTVAFHPPLLRRRHFPLSLTVASRRWETSSISCGSGADGENIDWSFILNNSPQWWGLLLGPKSASLKLTPLCINEKHQMMAPHAAPYCARSWHDLTRQSCNAKTIMNVFFCSSSLFLNDLGFMAVTPPWRPGEQRSDRCHTLMNALYRWLQTGYDHVVLRLVKI